MCIGSRKDVNMDRKGAKRKRESKEYERKKRE
jgi:hypothetical protein